MRTAIEIAQGSSLSNIMFPLLLNDYSTNCQSSTYIGNAHVSIYVDDVVAIVTAPTVDQLECKVNIIARDLDKWFRINGLILNTSIAHYVHFNLSGRVYRPRQGLRVAVRHVIMDQVISTTFWGLIT